MSYTYKGIKFSSKKAAMVWQKRVEEGFREIERSQKYPVTLEEALEQKKALEENLCQILANSRSSFQTYISQIAIK